MKNSEKKISYHKSFKKNYQKRIGNNKKLIIKVEKFLDLFLKNRNHPLLKDHQLKGILKDYRAFSITGDIRIIYKETEDYIILLDIGTYAQVYDL